MSRLSKLLLIVASVAVVASLAAWTLSRQPHLRFVDGDVEVMGCAPENTSEACVQLRCQQAVKRNPLVGLDARVEFTHYRSEPNGDLWHMGLAHAAAGAHRAGDYGFACRVSGPRVVDTIVDPNFRPGG